MRGANFSVMNSLTIAQMELECRHGNTLTNIVDGACLLWGGGQAIKIVFYGTPVTGTVATVMDVGCGLWGLYTFGKKVL